MRALASFWCALALALWAGAALAQSSPDGAINYELWEDLASLSETAVDQRSEATETFEGLRTRVATFRAQFSKARDANSDRIAALREQLDALGPAPEEGAVEAEDIATQRAELESRLRALEAPSLVAEAAFRRADSLIREIDELLRERQARRLFAIGPSPLNPVHWGSAVQELGDGLAGIAGETRGFRTEEHRRQASEAAPVALLSIAFGLLMLLRGRGWVDRALQRLRRLEEEGRAQGQGVWGFLISLFRIILPLIGLYAIMFGIEITGLVGPRSQVVLNQIPIWGAILLGFRWLSERLFSSYDDVAVVPLIPERRKEARYYALLLAVLYVLHLALAVVLSLGRTSVATQPVLALPLVVLIALILFRLGQILRRYTAPKPDSEEEPASTREIGLAASVRLSGTFTMIVSCVAPVMAVAGFSEAGNALLFPTILTLVIFAHVLVFQRFAADVYGLITGKGEDGRDALIPVLVGFILIVLALPVTALAWGVRPAELSEVWNRFAEGFQIGDSRVSPTDFLTFAVIFALGYAATRFFQRAMRSNVLPKTRIDPGGQKAIVSGLGYIGIFLSAVVAITTVGIDLSSIALVAGALTVGIGFGLQNIVNNFISGIILLVERPISEGDWIEVGGQMGYVRQISVRSTRIETFDRTDVIVPNSDFISGTVTNYTRGDTIGRLIVHVGVAYGTDTEKVDRILREIAEDQPMVLRNPPPSVVFNAFGADALEFQIRMILRDVNWILSVKNDVNHAIAKRFAEEGIEVPFAQRDIWLRNPEALREGHS